MKPINWVWQERNGFKTHLTYPDPDCDNDLQSSYEFRYIKFCAHDIYEMFMKLYFCSVVHVDGRLLIWSSSLSYEVQAHSKSITTSVKGYQSYIQFKIFFFFFQEPVTFYLKFACQFETIIIYMQKRVTFQHKGTKL